MFCCNRGDCFGGIDADATRFLVAGIAINTAVSVSSRMASCLFARRPSGIFGLWLAFCASQVGLILQIKVDKLCVVSLQLFLITM